MVAFALYIIWSFFGLSIYDKTKESFWAKRGEGIHAWLSANEDVTAWVVLDDETFTNTGMTKGWSIFGKEIDGAIRKNIVDKLLPLEQVEEKESYILGKIPNLHSLIPYSLNAHKPVYKCTGKDGLKGEHITKAKNSRILFDGIIDEIRKVLNK